MKQKTLRYDNSWPLKVQFFTFCVRNKSGTKILETMYLMNNFLTYFYSRGDNLSLV